MYEILHELLHRTPFTPFQLRMTNGESYTIRNPREVLLMKTRFVLAFFKTDRFAVFDMPQVADVKPLRTRQKKK